MRTCTVDVGLKPGFPSGMLMFLHMSKFLNGDTYSGFFGCLRGADYASTHAEQSPISQQYCLPAGKKDLILLQTNSVLGKNLKRSVL